MWFSTCCGCGAGVDARAAGSAATGVGAAQIASGQTHEREGTPARRPSLLRKIPAPTVRATEPDAGDTQGHVAAVSATSGRTRPFTLPLPVRGLYLVRHSGLPVDQWQELCRGPGPVTESSGLGINPVATGMKCQVFANGRPRAVASASQPSANWHRTRAVQHIDCFLGHFGGSVLQL
jgi:hypothetical protein